MQRKWDGKLWPKVLMAAMMLSVALSPIPQTASAAVYRYSYSDTAGSVKLEGTRHAISGQDLVWINLDDQGKSQVYYRSIDNSEVKQITTHDGLKESPAVTRDPLGNVRIAWEDQRPGVSGTNWDIYAYDLESQTEKKLNTVAGQHGHISMDGHFAVWVESLTSEMYLHNFQTGNTVAIGKGRFPVVSNGRIAFISPTDGGLFLHSIASGRTERILELPYHQYVDWFAFKDQWVVWKQRDLNLKSHYAMMNVDTNPGVAVNLTSPSVKVQEHSAIFIGDGQAAWLEYRGSAVQITGADLYAKQIHPVTNGNRDQQLLGFNGNQIVMTDEKNQLMYRTVIRTEIAPIYGGPATSNQQDGVIKADGAALILGEGESLQNVRLEQVDPESLGAKFPASAMRILSKGWNVVADRPFHKPAVLTIHYDTSGISASQTRKIGLYRYDAETASWVFAGGLADAAAGSVNANITLPGIYVVMIYEPSFRDMEGHWAKETVEVLAARWLVSGMGPDKFAPNAPLTRAQFTKMLADAVGLEVNPSKQSTFSDVSAGYWGHPWIEAAAKAGWVKGYNGKFRPDDPLTREQMMTMIVQAMGGEQEALALSAADIQRLLTHDDAHAIADWAKPYAAWVVKEGIVQGAGGKLFPQHTSSRAEGATVIYQLLIQKGDL